MDAAEKTGYAVIGLGHISQRAILPAFQNAKSSRLVALVSGDDAKAKSLSMQYGAAHTYTYEAFNECLGNPQVHAVYIATPNNTHPEFALRAAAAGKHILCEKPLGISAAQCRQMIEACRKNRVKLMVAYRKYFEPSTLELKRLIASGKLGNLRLIHTAFTNALPAGGNSWHLRKSLAGGGSLLDLGIYGINTVRWLTGLEPLEATAHTWTAQPDRFSEVEDNISFQLTFPGALYLQGSSSFSAAKASFLQIHGEKGWAALNPAYAYNEERRFFGKIAGEWFEKKIEIMDEFAPQLDHLSDCIRENRDPLPDGLAGLRDAVVIQAIYVAAALNRTVPIPVVQ